MTSPSPSQLWRAAVDAHPHDPLAARGAYRASMLELGYIEPGMPMTAPMPSIDAWPEPTLDAHESVSSNEFGPPRSSLPSTRVPQPCQPEFDLIDHQPPMGRVWPAAVMFVVFAAAWLAVVNLVL